MIPIFKGRFPYSHHWGIGCRSHSSRTCWRSSNPQVELRLRSNGNLKGQKASTWRVGSCHVCNHHCSCGHTSWHNGCIHTALTAHSVTIILGFLYESDAQFLSWILTVLWFSGSLAKVAVPSVVQSAAFAQSDLLVGLTLVDTLSEVSYHSFRCALFPLCSGLWYARSYRLVSGGLMSLLQ